MEKEMLLELLESSKKDRELTAKALDCVNKQIKMNITILRTMAFVLCFFFFGYFFSNYASEIKEKNSNYNYNQNTNEEE